MEHIAGAAGGALGYIHGDVRGAVAGYKLGQEAYKLTKKRKNMAPHGRRGSDGSVSGSSVGSGINRFFGRGGRQQVRTPNKVGRLMPLKNRKRKIDHAAGATTRKPSDTGPFKGKLAFGKGRKKVKVSKKFVQKVGAALVKKAPEGHYFETGCEGLFNSTDNTQNVQPVPAVFSSQGTKGLMFDPASVLQAASALFNGFTAVAAKTASTAGQFSYRNIIIDVKSSYGVHYLKNNGQRTLEVDIYEVGYKANNETVSDINTAFAQCLTDDNTNSININNYGINTMHVTPSMSPEFKRRFKFVKRQIILEPGQFHQIITPGPKNMRYDFSKFWRATNFVNAQPMARTLMFIVKTDLIASTNAGVADTIGRLKEKGKANVNGLLIESTVHYHIAMPDQAGFVYPTVVVGASQFLGYRHPARYVLNVTAASAGGAVQQRAEEENPLSMQTDPS